jgi:hypothetical protein
MVTCMGCLIVGIVCSINLTRSAVFSKQVVMSSCLEAERSCNGVGHGDRMSRLLANSPSQWLARNVARGSSLESVSVRRRKCSGKSARRSLRKYINAFFRVSGILFRRWGFAHKISASESSWGRLLVESRAISSHVKEKEKKKSLTRGHLKDIGSTVGIQLYP